MLHSVNGGASREDRRQPPVPPPPSGPAHTAPANLPFFGTGRLVAVFGILAMYLGIAVYLLNFEGMALWTSVLSSFGIMLAGGLLVRLTLGIPFTKGVRGATYQALQAWAQDQASAPVPDANAPTQPPRGV